VTRQVRWLAATISLAVFVSVPDAAVAQSDDKLDQLLLRLKEKGILSDDEYQQLLARTATPSTGAAAAPATEVTTRPPQPAQEAAAQALAEDRSVHMLDKGVGIAMGDVSIKFSGSVNGFYVHDNGDRVTPTTEVTGGLATVGKKSSAVRNGLLPGFLKIDVTTNQDGWDVGAHFGLYPGINSVTGVGGANSSGNPVALASSGLDVRQTYLTFGKPALGEVKIGRDIGLFASEAILNDITLLSVGSAGGNAAPSNTSLGRIGLGYIYPDWQPQITYTSPKLGGFVVSVGVFQPLETVGNDESNGTPGFQAKLVYDFEVGKLASHLWLAGLVQKHDGLDGFPSYTGRAFDAGAKLTYGPATIVGYLYAGKGVGTTGLFILSTDALGRRRKSDGFYVQGTYAIGKLTLGGSYGESQLSFASGEFDPLLLRSNSSWVGQARYGLTPWVTLIGEYIHTRSEAHGPNYATSDALAVGGILFF
jgi:predicted porin